MQPGVADRFGSERYQRIVTVFGVAAAEAATGWRVHRIAVQPFGDATDKGTGLGLVTWQSAVELGHARPFVEKAAPVFARPAIAADAKQRDHLCLVKR